PLNSKGMRGPEVADAKAPDTKRILFIGDSFTLGYTVDDADNWVRVCERELRGAGVRVEALNAGSEGYSHDQELVYLEEDGVKLKPDVVVFAPYLNDVFWNTQDKY